MLKLCEKQQEDRAREAAAEETQKPGYISKDGNKYFYKGTQLTPNQSVITQQGMTGTFEVMDGQYMIRYESSGNMSQNQRIDPDHSISIEIVKA